MAELINPNRFVDSIIQGSAAPQEKNPVVISTGDESPSAMGGLAALGATIIGATAIGRKIPAIRNLFKREPVSQFKNPIVETTKPSFTGNLPTATGQAQELVTTSKALTIPKSKYGEVADIPFTQGKGYAANPLDNPLVGHASYDRVLEAPFEKAPAQEWIKWLSSADSGQLKVPSGTLAGVSRQVQKEELADLNLLTQQGKEVNGGFLKSAMDEGLEVDRETLLKFIKNSPLNHIKPMVKVAPGNIMEDVASLVNDLRPVQNKLTAELKVPAGTLPQTKQSLEAIEESYADIMSKLQDLSYKGITSNSALSASDIKAVQQGLLNIGKQDPELAEVTKNALVKFNRVTGVYNNRASPIAQEGFYTNLDRTSGLPRHKQAQNGAYDIMAGENFTEKVFLYDSKIPNVSRDRFSYVGQSPHFNSKKELFFVRYDDLPNPKLGGRHIRVSEAQSDLHQPATSANKNRREEFFKNRINPFNAEGTLDIYKKQINDLREQIRPYTEVGRGVAGFTKQQAQDFNRLNYKIKQLEKSALNSIINKGALDSTTYGPLGFSFNDYIIKDLMRTMAKRNINHISIVPSSINGNIKNFQPDKFGNEVNYGLMKGNRFIPETKLDKKTGKQIKTGKYVESSKYSILNDSLNRIAKQYGAKFDLQPMPKSNPNKPFKVIQIFDSKNNNDFKQAVESGRAHYTHKRGNHYLYEDHVAAADTQEQADLIAKAYNSSSSARGDVMVKQLSPDSPQNYEMVPTLSASSEVLKKFLLPFKAYMFEGGFVDKTNIFKSIV